VNEGFIAHRFSTGNGGVHMEFTDDGLVSRSVRDTGLVDPQAVFQLLDADDGSWFATVDGSLYRTTDLGLVWTKDSVPDEPFLLGISLEHGSGFVWSQYDMTYMHRTSDYGATWSLSLLPDTGYVQCVATPTEHVAYMILHTLQANGSYDLLKWTSGEAVANQSRGPSTILQVRSIGASRLHFGFAPAGVTRSLKIYDLLGRETGSTEIAAGTSAALIDASPLPAAVYFARLGSSVTKFELVR